MPSLDRSQADFAAALMNPALSAPDGIRQSGDDTARPGDGRRFNVYRNNIAIAAIDALADIFPAVQAIVGEEFFRAAARVYFEKFPPASPILFRYGDKFGAFLADFPPAASVPYLSDVAALEFARLRAYHAADVEPIRIECLADIPADQIDAVGLVAHPSVSLIRSAYPIVSLWGASSGLLDGDEINLNQSEDALIVRPGMEVNTIALPPGGGMFLEALLTGSTLGEAAALASEVEEQFDLSSHLAGLFLSGVIAGVDTGTTLSSGELTPQPNP